ncbi:MAG: spore cortex biosynthesis protein YabQ [Lachnospiraceae bacterium]|nr:spore cortex biosynthesis protein YabQ [Lachnospiraceae bacterium]
MSVEIMNQLRFLLLSLCLGMGIMAGYDVLRLFRWLIPHGSLWIWLEDLLFWCFAAFPSFLIFFLFNQGIIRWYGVVSVIAGALLYEFGISRVVRRWGDSFFLPKKQKLYRMFVRQKQKWMTKRKKRMFCADCTKNMKKSKKD